MRSIRPLWLLGLLPLAACGAIDRTSASADGGDGRDGGVDEGTGICAPTSANNPDGLKDIKYLDSYDTVYPGADWRVALEPSTRVSWATFPGALSQESAYILDISDPTIEVAGFLVSRASVGANALQESQAAVSAILTAAHTVTVRASGSNIQSLDGFDSVVSTALEVTSASATDATSMRQVLMPVLLGRPSDTVFFGDAGWLSASDTKFVVVMQTLYRAETEETLYMGAVVRALDYDNRNRSTGLHADDLANGSGLTLSKNGEARECDDATISQQAVADVIWVIDESASTDDDRAAIASNAAEFFEKAVDLGLDFRMGVTDMNDASLGMFSLRNADNTNERWILPSEPDLFAAAITDPSGPAAADFSAEHGLTQMQAALTAHLPRSDADPLKIREGAKVAVIIETDEKAQELKDASVPPTGNYEPTPEQAAGILAFVQPYITALNDADAIAHLISEPLPFGPSCSGGGNEEAYGYNEVIAASGGQTGSLCQVDLGATLDAMLDSIVADATPLQLEYVPISSSISVKRDGVVIPRSRKLGWDYRGSSNAIVFYGMPVDPAHPAEIQIGYRRWAEQVLE